MIYYIILFLLKIETYYKIYIKELFESNNDKTEIKKK